MIPAVAFLNLGPSELVLILLLLLLFFGADKAPQLARSLGKARAEVDRAQRELHEAMLSEDEKQAAEQVKFERAREAEMARQNAEFETLRKAAEDLGISTVGMTSSEQVKSAITAKLAGAQARGSGSENAANAQQ